MSRRVALPVLSPSPTKKAGAPAARTRRPPLLPPSCDGCGACCKGWLVDVSPCSDNVPEELVKASRALGHCMRMRDDACIALKNNRCSIYENRPKVCRDFERGSKRCLDKLREARNAQPSEAKFR